MKEKKEMTDDEIVREGNVNSIHHKIQKEYVTYRDDYISKLEGKISALRIEEKRMTIDPPNVDYKKMNEIKEEVMYEAPLAFFYLAVWDNFFRERDNYRDLPINILEWIESHDTFIGRLYEDYYLKVQEASFLLTEQILDMVNGYYYKDNPEDFEDDEEAEWQDPDYKAQLKEDLEKFKEDLEKLEEKENDCLNCPDAGKCDSYLRQFCEASRKSSKEREKDEANKKEEGSKDE